MKQYPQIEVQKEVKANLIDKEEEINELVVDSNKNTSNNVVEMKDSMAGKEDQNKDNKVQALEAEILSLNTKEVNLNGKIIRFTKIMKNMSAEIKMLKETKKL